MKHYTELQTLLVPINALFYILCIVLIGSYKFRRNRQRQGAHTNLVKTYSNKIVFFMLNPAEYVLAIGIKWVIFRETFYQLRACRPQCKPAPASTYICACLFYADDGGSSFLHNIGKVSISLHGVTFQKTPIFVVTP